MHLKLVLLAGLLGFASAQPPSPSNAIILDSRVPKDTDTVIPRDAIEPLLLPEIPKVNVPGTTIVFSEINYKGVNQVLNALHTCISDIPTGAIHSLIQFQGVWCDYYHGRLCDGDLPKKTIDSMKSDMVWPDLGDWSGQLHSIKCVDSKQSKENINPSNAAAPSPGDLLLCDNANWQGQCLTLSVRNACLDTIHKGWLHSVVQFKGAVCAYHSTSHCERDKEVVKIDSVPEFMVWQDMKDWGGKILSIRCHLPGTEPRGSETAIGFTSKGHE
ncbi:hypothetical protein BS50DRAFT_636413 [Corynespora cassiicola Philippines]|uniref:Uncharacterized protein n=1 Tax=Corynespora cassiicola Philippines TaxID=1448308 RepID=A0A2T2NFJ9_CORCC|nr:hypothetical protein BS50DRAFT_636413 [Corynespora cassiicola Philippines]